MRSDGFFMRAWKIIYPMLIIMLLMETVVTIYMLIVALVGNLQGYSMGTDMLMDAVAQHNMFLVGISEMAAACILVYFYQKDKKVIHVKANKFHIVHIFLLIILSIAACLGINFTMDILQLNVIFASTANEISSTLYSEPIWVQVISMVVMAPLAEELAFRGLIFKRTRTYTKFLAASLLTAMLFGLYHGNVLQFIYAFLVSWILTLVYEQFLSLKFCILVHAVMNATSVFASNSIWFQDLEWNNWQYLAITFAADMIAILCILLLLGPLGPKEEET